MLGDNLLPVHNVPCTARICQIMHKLMAEGEQPFLTEKDPATKVSTLVATGSNAIVKYLEHLNDLARLENGSKLEQEVDITAQFPALMDGPAGASPQTRMCVIDTPGIRYSCLVTYYTCPNANPLKHSQTDYTVCMLCR